MIEVEVRSSKGHPRASTPVTISETACAMRVPRRFSTSGSLLGADFRTDFPYGRGQRINSIRMTSRPSENRVHQMHERPQAVLREAIHSFTSTASTALTLRYS